MVHPYYSNYPNYYYDFNHHFLSRFLLFVISIVLIVLAICDYSVVDQTWFTSTINAIIILAGICGILCCIFVSFSLLEFTFLMFMISFGLQIASLIYRAIADVSVNTWGYGIALAILLFVSIFVALHLIRWFHAEIIGGKYDLPTSATGGGATTNIAIAQPPTQQQQPIQQPIQPIQQPILPGYTSSTTTSAGAVPTQPATTTIAGGSAPTTGTTMTGAPPTTFGADPLLGPGPMAGPARYPTSVAY